MGGSFPSPVGGGSPERENRTRNADAPEERVGLACRPGCQAGPVSPALGTGTAAAYNKGEVDRTDGRTTEVPRDTIRPRRGRGPAPGGAGAGPLRLVPPARTGLGLLLLPGPGLLLLPGPGLLPRAGGRRRPAGLRLPAGRGAAGDPLPRAAVAGQAGGAVAAPPGGARIRLPQIGRASCR